MAQISSAVFGHLLLYLSSTSLVIPLVNPSPLWNNICASDSQPRADMGKVLRSEVVFPTLTLGESEAEKSYNLADWQINGSEARWRSAFL